MSEPFIGEIRLFGFSFAPRGWAPCDGRLLPIASYNALFALVGTQYGGDGRTTFGLPDLRGRVPVGAGPGPGLTDHRVGDSGGAETVALTPEQLPSHSHRVVASSRRARAARPTERFLARVTRGRAYAGTGDVLLHGDAVRSSGGDQAHPNLQPYLSLSYCIALEGVFPNRA